MISVTDKILILSGTLWLIAVGFIIFSWVLHARQQIILKYIAARLDALEKKCSGIPTQQSDNQKKEDFVPPKTTLTISKDEPLSKYEDMILSDEVDIKFIDNGH